MIVVGHDRECSNIDKEHRSEAQHITFYLVSSVFIGTTSEMITATEESTSHASRYTVIEGSGVKRDLLLAWFSHNDYIYS